MKNNIIVCVLKLLFFLVNKTKNTTSKPTAHDLDQFCADFYLHIIDYFRQQLATSVSYTFQPELDVDILLQAQAWSDTYCFLTVCDPFLTL